MGIIVGHDVAANMIPYNYAYAQALDEQARRNAGARAAYGGNAPAVGFHPYLGSHRDQAFFNRGKQDTDAGFYWDGQQNANDAFGWTATPEPTISGNQLVGSSQAAAFQEATRNYEPYNWRENLAKGIALGDRNVAPIQRQPTEGELSTIRREDRVEADNYDKARAKEQADWNKAKSLYAEGNQYANQIEDALGVQGGDSAYDEAGTGVVPKGPTYDTSKYLPSKQRDLDFWHQAYADISSDDGMTEADRAAKLKEVRDNVQKIHTGEAARLAELGENQRKEQVRQQAQIDAENRAANEKRDLAAEKAIEKRAADEEKAVTRERERRDRLIERAYTVLKDPLGNPPSKEKVVDWVREQEAVQRALDGTDTNVAPNEQIPGQKQPEVIWKTPVSALPPDALKIAHEIAASVAANGGTMQEAMARIEEKLGAA